LDLLLSNIWGVTHDGRETRDRNDLFTPTVTGKAQKLPSRAKIEEVAAFNAGIVCIFDEIARCQIYRAQVRRKGRDVSSENPVQQGRMIETGRYAFFPNIGSDQECAAATPGI
jgi:hypothetical protein